jgi:hypothetical protein
MAKKKKKEKRKPKPATLGDIEVNLCSRHSVTMASLRNRIFCGNSHISGILNSLLHFRSLTTSETLTNTSAALPGLLEPQVGLQVLCFSVASGLSSAPNACSAVFL